MKRKKTTVYKVDPSSKEKRIAAILEFSEKGDRTLEQHYMQDGERINEETRFTYDDNGNLTQKEITNHEEESHRMEFSYNDKDYLIEEKVFVNDQLEQHRKVEWAEDYLSSKTAYFDAEGALANIVETVLVEKETIQKETIYDAEENPVETYLYEYENGNLAKKTVDFGGFTTVETFEYTLDTNGNITSKKRIDDEGDTEIQETEYHPNGKKARQEVTQVSGVKEIIQYDEKEREVQVYRIDLTGYKSFESRTRYTDDHEFVSEKVIRNDESVTQFLYEHMFFEE